MSHCCGTHMLVLNMRMRHFNITVYIGISKTFFFSVFLTNWFKLILIANWTKLMGCQKHYLMQIFTMYILVFCSVMWFCVRRRQSWLGRILAGLFLVITVEHFLQCRQIHRVLTDWSSTLCVNMQRCVFRFVLFCLLLLMAGNFGTLMLIFLVIMQRWEGKSV